MASPDRCGKLFPDPRTGALNKHGLYAAMQLPETRPAADHFFGTPKVNQLKSNVEFFLLTQLRRPIKILLNVISVSLRVVWYAILNIAVGYGLIIGFFLLEYHYLYPNLDQDRIAKLQPLLDGLRLPFDYLRNLAAATPFNDLIEKNREYLGRELFSGVKLTDYLLVLCAIFQLIIYTRQARIMNNQTFIMTDAMYNRNRAKLSVEDVVVQRLKPRRHLIANLIIENHGFETGKILSVDAETYISHNSVAPVKSKINLRRLKGCSVSKAWLEERKVDKGASTRYKVVSNFRLSDEIVSDLSEKKLVLFLSGKVTYSSTTTGATPPTRFDRVFDPTSNRFIASPHLVGGAAVLIVPGAHSEEVVAGDEAISAVKRTTFWPIQTTHLTKADAAHPVTDEEVRESAMFRETTANAMASIRELRAKLDGAKERLTDKDAIILDLRRRLDASNVERQGIEARFTALLADQARHGLWSRGKVAALAFRDFAANRLHRQNRASP